MVLLGDDGGSGGDGEGETNVSLSFIKLNNHCLSLN